MAQTAEKISVSIPRPLAVAVRGRVGSRGLSSFVARALSHELEREQLGTFIAELVEKHGAPSKAALAKARRAWPKR